MGVSVDPMCVGHVTACLQQQESAPPNAYGRTPVETDPPPALITPFLSHNRAKLDSNAALADFCTDLEAAVIETIESGSMTKDLAICVHGTTKVTPDQYLNTTAFMEAISTTFQQKRQAKSKM